MLEKNKIKEMKRIITSSIIASALIVGLTSVNSCSKVDDIIDNISIPVPFAINVNKNNLDIPFIVGTEYVKSPSIPLGINLDAEIKERFQGMSVDNVKSAKLASLSIGYVSSTNGTKLNAVSDAKVWISAPNQTDRIIATVTNNTSADALSFTPVTTEPEAELMNYLKSPQVAIYLEIKGPDNKIDQMKININSSFRIQVGF